MINIYRFIGVLGIAAIVFSCTPQETPAKEQIVEPKKVDMKLFVKAYLYGYPMLTMDYTHKVSTNVVAPNGKGKAPINQWASMTKFPNAGFTQVVRPNVDTYYSLVFTDLSLTPLYLEIPETERY